MSVPLLHPDLSSRPYTLSAERLMQSSPVVLYHAWTKGFDLWFAEPGSVTMSGQAGAPFFFETVFKPESGSKAQRHPHYGRVLRLEQDRLVQLTWVTGAGGTNGAETVVTVELTPQPGGTLLSLTHAGFADVAARDGHEQAWPSVLEQLDMRMQENA